MRFRKFPITFPCIVYIAAFPKEESESVTEVLHRIILNYSPTYSETDTEFRFTTNSMEGYVKGIEEQECQVFLVIFSPKEELRPSQLLLKEQKSYKEHVRKLEAIMSRKPLSTFILRIGWSESLEKAQLVLKEYLNQGKYSIRSMGIVHGCLLATLEESSIFSQSLRRNIIVISFDHEIEEARRIVWKICSDLTSLASYTGRLNQLRLNCNPILNQIDASERSTQFRINEIFVGLRRPVKEVKIEDLEDVLREVTTLFSSLSVLVGAMRRDYVKAQSLLRNAVSLFKTWNEKPLNYYPTNSLMEIDSYEDLIAPFKDFISRVDALRTQLNTVLDTVRTYLGIQEQKLSIEEQASSKDLLARLVSLQEVLHKLEILIVAFYITEMGRLIFDVIAHEISGILTIAFIPIALFMSVAILRLLHKH